MARKPAGDKLVSVSVLTVGWDAPTFTHGLNSSPWYRIRRDWEDWVELGSGARSHQYPDVIGERVYRIQVQSLYGYRNAAPPTAS